VTRFLGDLGRRVAPAGSSEVRATDRFRSETERQGRPVSPAESTGTVSQKQGCGIAWPGRTGRAIDFVPPRIVAGDLVSLEWWAENVERWVTVPNAVVCSY
jgi:hypothetical protein